MRMQKLKGFQVRPMVQSEEHERTIARCRARMGLPPEPVEERAAIAATVEKVLNHIADEDLKEIENE